MTPQEKVKQVLVVVAMGKMFTEQTTFLIGELKQKPKQDFNIMVLGIDKWIGTIEKNLNEEEMKLLQELTDSFHEIAMEIRKVAEI